MTTIKLSIWFMIRSFINSIKRAWKITLAIVGIILFMVIAGAVVGAIVSDEDDTQVEEISDDEDVSEDEGEYEINEEFDLVGGENGEPLILYYQGDKYNAGEFLPELICGIIILGVIIFAIHKGAKKGVDIFTMPDVNFLFPAPMKPQSVLLFKIIGQIGTSLAGIIYFVYQIPNLCNAFNLSISSIVLLTLCVVILVLSSKIINVWTYCVLSKAPRIKELVARFGFGLIFIPVIIIGILNKILGLNIVDSIIAVFASTPSRIIPFFGWLKAACAYAFKGEVAYTLMFTLITILFLVVLAWSTWKMDVDFYEDALRLVTVKNQETEAILQQANGGTGYGVRHEGGRQEKKWDKIRNNILSFDGYEGAKVLFCKTIINRRRFYPLKGLWSNTCNMYFFFAAGCIVGVTYIFHSNPVYIIMAGIIVCMFFKSFLSPMAEETGHIFIYLFPESPFSIVFWGMLGQVLECALDLLPAFIMLFVVSGNPAEIIMWYLVLISVNLFLGMASLVVDVVISFYLPVIIVNLMQLIIRTVPVIPIVIAAVIGVITSNAIIALMLVLIINVVVSAVCYVPCSLFLFKGKK